MGCPCRTHINTHLGPMWVLYILLAGKGSFLQNYIEIGPVVSDKKIFKVFYIDI